MHAVAVYVSSCVHASSGLSLFERRSREKSTRRMAPDATPPRLQTPPLTRSKRQKKKKNVGPCETNCSAVLKLNASNGRSLGNHSLREGDPLPRETKGELNLMITQCRKAWMRAPTIGTSGSDVTRHSGDKDRCGWPLLWGSALKMGPPR